MKKIIFALVLIASLSSYSQEEVSPQPKNEVYLNTFNLITFKWLDISYERILNEESSVGISTLVSLDNESFGYDSYRSFAITPYYRHYFSNEYAKGFYMEAFTMINGGEYEDYINFYNESTDTYTDSYETGNYTDVAFGISLGGKFVSKRGFIGDIHAGVGRNLLDDNAPAVVGRIGISLGFRF